MTEQFPETSAGERRQLLGLAYRLLGSAADAEDAVQEAYVRLYRLDTGGPRADRCARRVVDDGDRADLPRHPGLGPRAPRALRRRMAAGAAARQRPGGRRPGGRRPCRSREHGRVGVDGPHGRARHPDAGRARRLRAARRLPVLVRRDRRDRRAHAAGVPAARVLRADRGSRRRGPSRTSMRAGATSCARSSRHGRPATWTAWSACSTRASWSSPTAAARRRRRCGRSTAGADRALPRGVARAAARPGLRGDDGQRRGGLVARDGAGDDRRRHGVRRRRTTASSTSGRCAIPTSWCAGADPALVMSAAMCTLYTWLRPARSPDQDPRDGMRVFLQVLVNTAVANVTTSYLWFALTFWVYIETRSVLATGIIGGAYMLLVAIFSMLFGTIVDRHRKHLVMMFAGVVTLVVVRHRRHALPAVPRIGAARPRRPDVLDLLRHHPVRRRHREHAQHRALDDRHAAGAGRQHANANGMVGTVQGLAFLVTSVFSGLSIGLLGMGWTLLIAIVLSGGRPRAPAASSASPRTQPERSGEQGCRSSTSAAAGRRCAPRPGSSR